MGVCKPFMSASSTRVCLQTVDNVLDVPQTVSAIFQVFVYLRRTLSCASQIQRHSVIYTQKNLRAYAGKEIR
jgi:hypothetical protein